ncbi:hypothetical protein BDF22DRAFT_330725 [Syncephalis plumigaleata]|nr:hypothetical protein BDF22DRAFT_330725 [Syncephalis plumigaleata]
MTPIMLIAAAIASVILAMSLGVAADPEGYPGAGSYRLTFQDTKCLRLINGNDPWFRDCSWDDPLNFDVLWKDEQVGDYIMIRSVQTDKCLAQERPLYLKDCNKDDVNVLWRYYHGDQYKQDEIKAITKVSDDKNNGEYDCLVHDKTAFFDGHAIRLPCNANEQTQFFKKAPAPGLPRY